MRGIAIFLPCKRTIELKHVHHLTSESDSLPEIGLTSAMRQIMRLPELVSPREQAILTVFDLLLKGMFFIISLFWCVVLTR